MPAPGAGIDHSAAPALEASRDVARTRFILRNFTFLAASGRIFNFRVGFLRRFPPLGCTPALIKENL
jgi:hypothetical protein